MNIQQALAQGFRYLESGNLSGAQQVFESVLQQDSKNFAALNGRGFVALQQNSLQASLVDFQASLAVNGKQPFARKMEAIVLGAVGRFDEAMKSFSAAIELDRKDPEIYFNRSNFRFQAGQSQEALADLDEALKLRPSYLEARLNRANLLIQAENFARAEKDLDYLVSKIANNPEIWVALGLVRYRLGKLREAMQCNEHVLKLAPNHPDALLNSASTTFEQKNYEASLDWADKGLAVAPMRADLYYAKANALAAMSRFEESLSAYGHAIELHPQYAEAFNARGLANASLRQLDEAVKDYDQAILLRPGYHDAIYNKSYAQLEHGDFIGGWQGYEHRFQVPALGIQPPSGIPVWQGLPVDGALLVRGEQGLGDQILFGTVLHDLLLVQPKLVLQLEPRLVPLFARSFPSVRVISSKDRAPSDVVAQISMGSLPQFFRRATEDFKKARAPYLFADQKQVDDFRTKLVSGSSQRVIGVSWRSFNNRFTQQKSMSLVDLASLFNLPDTSIVNLQYGDTAQEIHQAKDAGCVFNDAVQIDLTQDIDGLASLIMACDVIVTVSNTTAHIAAALGKKVLLMLPHRIGKLWYWSEVQGGHSLWYPSVTTFHQTQPDDWASTIDAVKASLLCKV